MTRKDDMSIPELGIESMGPSLNALKAKEIIIKINGIEALALHSQIQLALRHPANVGGTAEIVRQMALELEGAVGLTDELRALMKAGWDEIYDVIV